MNVYTTVVRRTKCRVEEYASSEGLVMSMNESKQHEEKGLQHGEGEKRQFESMQ